MNSPLLLIVFLMTSSSMFFGITTSAINCQRFVFSSFCRGMMAKRLLPNFEPQAPIYWQNEVTPNHPTETWKNFWQSKLKTEIKPSETKNLWRSLTPPQSYSEFTQTAKEPMTPYINSLASPFGANIWSDGGRNDANMFQEKKKIMNMANVVLRLSPTEQRGLNTFSGFYVPFEELGAIRKKKN